MKQFIVHEILPVIYYVEAETEEQAIEKAKEIGPRDFHETDWSVPHQEMWVEPDSNYAEESKT